MFSFDSVSSADESWSATVTTQTVEYGFDITDNINIEPPTYDINASISNYSLFSPDKEIVWNGDTFSSLSEPDYERHIRAREELLKIFTERSILTLVESSANSNNTDLQQKYDELISGHYREIENCVITSLSIGHPDNATGVFYVSLKLQKIFIALVTTTELSESEMIPSLRPLVVNTNNVSSKASSSDDSGTDDGNNVAEAVTDSGTKSDVFSGGISQSEGQAYRLRELKPIQDKIVAEKKLLEVQKRTGQNWMIVERSGAYYLEPTG